jgi:hypothetical protein
MHDPLSQRLAKILEQDAQAPGRDLTMNQVLERTAGRGLYLVMILLCAPFVTPVPLPAVSTAVGAVLLILGLRLLLGLPPRLPSFLGERPLPPGLKRIVLGGGVRLLQWIERFARPRRTQWLSWPAARIGHALLIILLALLLALPVPPFMLFSNSLPSLAIILIATAIMEEDGLMIWLAYLTSLVTALWFALSAGFIVAFLARAYDWLQNYLHPSHTL